jgi:hypothetical protein
MIIDPHTNPVTQIKVLAGYVSTAANKFQLSISQILHIMRQTTDASTEDVTAENCMKEKLDLSELQPEEDIKEAIKKGKIWKGSKVIHIPGNKYVFNRREIRRWTDEGEWPFSAWLLTTLICLAH